MNHSHVTYANSRPFRSSLIKDRRLQGCRKFLVPNSFHRKVDALRIVEEGACQRTEIELFLNHHLPPPLNIISLDWLTIL